MRQSSKRPGRNCSARNEYVRDLAEQRGRHAAKLNEIAEALVAAGFRTVDEQAKELGLPRSTTWAIVKGKHKYSGLSSATIKQLLANSHLNPLVRHKIIEYVKERCVGIYGDDKKRLYRFVSRLSEINVEHNSVDSSVVTIRRA